MLSLRTRHPREIYFRLLRSVGTKNYGFVSSDAREEAGEKILPQGVYGRARPSGGRNRILLLINYPMKLTLLCFPTVYSDTPQRVLSFLFYRQRRYNNAFFR